MLTPIAARLRGYFARRLLSLPDDVEDLVQETVLMLHLQRGNDDPAVTVSAWVHAIERHQRVDLCRRHGRHEALHDIDEVLNTHCPKNSRHGAAWACCCRRCTLHSATRLD